MKLRNNNIVGIELEKWLEDFCEYGLDYYPLEFNFDYLFYLDEETISFSESFGA